MASASPASAPAPKRRRWPKIVLGVVVVLGVLVALAPTLLSGVVKGKVQASLAERIDGDVEIGEMSLGWLSGAEVKGVVVRRAGIDAPTLELESLNADVGIFKLITGSGFTGNIEIDGLHVRAIREKGQLDVQNIVKPGPPTPKEEENAPLPKLDLKIVVRNIAVTYEDRDAGTPAETERFKSLSADLVSGRPFKIALDGGERVSADALVDMMHGDHIAPMSEIRASGSLKLGRIDLNDLAGLAQDWVTGLSGNIEKFDQRFEWGDGRLKLVGPIRATRLQAGLPGVGIFAAGSIDGDFDVKIADGGWEPGTAKLRIAKLAARTVAMRDTFEATSLDADIAFDDATHAHIEKLALRSPALNADATGKAEILGGSFTGKGQAKLQGDVTKLMALVDGLPDMKGALRSNVTVERKAGGELIIGGGSTIQDFEARNLPGGVAPVSEKTITLKHDLEIGPRVWKLSDVGLNASFARVSAKGTFEPAQGNQPPGGEVTLTSNADLDLVTALVGQFMPLKLSGKLETAGAIRGSQNGYTIRATSNGTGLRAEGGPLAGGPLDLGTTKLAFDGTVSTNGADWNVSKLDIASTPVTGKIQGRLVGLDTASPTIGGKGTLDADLQALVRAWKAPRDVGNLGRGQFDFALDLANDRLQIERFRAKAAGVTASATGTMTLPSGDRLQDGKLQVNVGGRFDDVKHLLPMPLEILGNVQTVATVTTSAQGYAVVGSVTGSGVRVTGGPLEGGPLDLGQVKLVVDGSSDADATAINVKKLDVTSTVATGTVAGQVSGLGEDSPAFTGSGNLNADLAALARAMGPTLDRVRSLGRGTTQFDVTLRNQRLDMRKVVADFSGLRAEASGHAVLATGGGLPVAGTTNLHLRGEVARLQSLVDVPIDLSGTSNAHAKITFGTPISFDAQLGGQKLVARGEAIGPQPVNVAVANARLKGTYDEAKGALVLSEGAVTAPFVSATLTGPGRVSGLGGDQLLANVPMKGNLDFGKAPPAFFPPDLRISGLATYEVSGGLDAGGVMVERMQFNSPNLFVQRVGKVTMQGPLTLSGSSRSDGNVSLRLQSANLRFTGSDGKSSQAPLTAEITGRRPPNSERWDLSRIVVNGAGINARGRADWNPTGNTVLDLNGELALDELARTLLPLMFPDMRASGRGRFVVKASIPMNHANPGKFATGNWEMNLAHVETPSVAVQNLVTRGRIANGYAVIDQGTANVNDGTAAVTGRVDFHGPRPRWQGSLVAQNVRIREEWQPAIARVIPLFSGLGVKLNGRINTNLNVSGVGSDFDESRPTITGMGDLGINQGSLAGGPILSGLTQLVGLNGHLNFNPIATRFRMQNGSVIQDALVLSAQQVDFKMGGRTGLDGALDYTLGVKVKSGQLGKFQQYARVLSPDGFLPVRLGGNISSPSLKPPDIGAAVGNALENTLRKGLGGIFGPKKKDDKKKNK